MLGDLAAVLPQSMSGSAWGSDWSQLSRKFSASPSLTLFLFTSAFFSARSVHWLVPDAIV